MTNDRLKELSVRLQAGDSAAAEEIFRTYGPYLQMVVRRKMTPRLRSRFDSQDVVQSVWTDTLLQLREERRPWSFSNAARLRSFLVRLTLNRFIDFYRRNRAALDRETSLSPIEESTLSTRTDRPSEIFEANELWARLLRICSPAHQEILRLRLDGLTLNEIAERTGFHESSVRRILYELAERLDSEASAPEARSA